MLYIPDSRRNLAEILAIAVPYASGQRLQLSRIDKTCAVRNLFRTGHLQSLPFLDRLHERTGFQQRVVCTRVQPGNPAARTSTNNSLFSM